MTMQPKMGSRSVPYNTPKSSFKRYIANIVLNPLKRRNTEPPSPPKAKKLVSHYTLSGRLRKEDISPPLPLHTALSELYSYPNPPLRLSPTPPPPPPPPPPFFFREGSSAPDTVKLEVSIGRHTVDLVQTAQEHKMDGSLLVPRAAAGTKFRQIEKAKEMQQIVEERANRAGVEPPQYEFLELIGRGSFGRVFKCKCRKTQEIVAVKITEVDAEDYNAHFKDKDRNVSDLIKEINVLQQLKESKARPYVNIIYEAFSMHSELWIVSEYCPGGSVHTLMKATPVPGLEERYIVAIVRELATAVKFIHEAGILHRDIKCGNILITEDGKLQLCDFGVSGVLESEVAKRSTIVGTPNWMAPEIQKEMGSSDFQFGTALFYGQEIDVWALGITVYELATGGPPEVKMVPGGIVTYKSLPRLSGEKFSEPLRDLVAYVLKEDATERPSAAQILQHPYIANTSETHPTSSLKQLIERYIRWEQSGGQRISLFNPNAGAQGPEPFIPPEDQDEDWNFSTSEEMERQFANLDQLGDPFHEDFTNDNPDQNHVTQPGMGGSRFSIQRKENAIRRGGEGLQRIFDPNSTPYKYGSSDLALRREYGTQESNNRETMINLDDAEPTFTIPSLELGDVPTIRARYSRPIIDLDEEEEGYTATQQTRRATRDWKFPDMAATQRPNRKTVEWSFATAMAEAGQSQNLPRRSRQLPRENFPPPLNTAPIEEARDRKTRDFVFPPRDSGDNQASSISDQGPSLPPQPDNLLAPSFRPNIRHIATEPVGAFEDYYHQPTSAPESPRTSMIDLDLAVPSDYYERPATSSSAGDSLAPQTGDFNNADPFDLEDQVQLSRDNNRTSYHMKSQSEPNHSIAGLLTPSDKDSVSDGPSRAAHARGVSQFTGPSQQSIAMNNRSRARQRRGLHPPRESSLSSNASTSTSEAETTDDDDDPELKAMLNNDFWRNFHPDRYDPNARVPPLPPPDWNFGMDSFPAGSNLAIQPLTDADITTAPPRLNIRAPPGPGGQRRLVDFPLPVGPNPEALRHDVDAETFLNEFLKMQMQMMNALAVTKDVIIGADGRLVQSQPAAQERAVDM